MEISSQKNKIKKNTNDYKEYNYELCKKIENIQNELNNLDEENDSNTFKKKTEELEKLIIEVNNLHNFAREKQIVLYPSSYDITVREINSNLIKLINKIVSKNKNKKNTNSNNEKENNSLSSPLTYLSRMQLIDLKDYIMVSQYEGYVDEYYFEKGMPNDKYHFKNIQKMNYLQSIINCYESFFKKISEQLKNC